MKSTKFQLGADVTDKARAKTAKGTAVLSVRLTTDELEKLDAASKLAGKSISQVAREALASYAAFATHGANVTISGKYLAVSLGEASYVGRGEAQSKYEEVVLTGVV